jgi:hypothetical protein
MGPLFQRRGPGSSRKARTSKRGWRRAQPRSPGPRGLQGRRRWLWESWAARSPECCGRARTLLARRGGPASPCGLGGLGMDFRAQRSRCSVRGTAPTAPASRTNIQNLRIIPHARLLCPGLSFRAMPCPRSCCGTAASRRRSSLRPAPGGSSCPSCSATGNWPPTRHRH